MNPIIEQQIEVLRHRWPQSTAVESSFGSHLIIVPSVLLRGYNKTICTVLFVAPCGFPSACPENFWTDVQEMRLLKPVRKVYHLHDGDEVEYSDWVENTNERNPIPCFPHWKDLTWWSWHLQDWNPNSCSLMTYMYVIKNRLFPAR